MKHWNGKRFIPRNIFADSESIHYTSYHKIGRNTLSYLGEEVTNLFVVDFEVARPNEVLNVVGQRYLVEYVLRQQTAVRKRASRKQISVWARYCMYK